MLISCSPNPQPTQHVYATDMGIMPPTPKTPLKQASKYAQSKGSIRSPSHIQVTPMNFGAMFSHATIVLKHQHESATG